MINLRSQFSKVVGDQAGVASATSYHPLQTSHCRSRAIRDAKGLSCRPSRRKTLTDMELQSDRQT